jgi:acyl-CoA thioesterase
VSIPFAEHLGIVFGEAANGRSRCELPLVAQLRNSNGVAHGGVPFSLADTGMGAALKTMLAPGEACVTIELKMNYHRPGAGARLVCDSNVVHRGRTIATVESRVAVDGTLMASALGTFAIVAKS